MPGVGRPAAAIPQVVGSLGSETLRLARPLSTRSQATHAQATRSEATRSEALGDESVDPPIRLALRLWGAAVVEAKRKPPQAPTGSYGGRIAAVKRAEDTGLEPATHCWATDFESAC
jgi:hypothetical protein